MQIKGLKYAIFDTHHLYPITLDEEHVKNNCYLKLNCKNEENLHGYEWSLLALGKILFVSP